MSRLNSCRGLTIRSTWATTVWSPSRSSNVADPRRPTGWGEATKRAETDSLQQRYVGEENPPIVAAVQQVAEARGIPMAQVALAWVMENPSVVAPIVGPTKEQHLTDAVAALDVELTDEEIAALEAPYTPRLPSGFQ